MSVNEKHSDFNSLVTRYLSGELSPGALRDFEQLLQEDPEKRNLVDTYRKIWDSVGSVSERDVYDMDAEWSLLEARIPDLAGQETFTLDTGKPARTILFYTYRIAAVLVVGLLFTFAWFYSSRMAGMQRVVAENEPVELTLDDGTMVTLNRHSRIRYEKRFDGTRRQVYLSGEAWFDVARDTARPFLIDVGSAMVEVLGTSFNVNAYRQNTMVEITVKSGVVALTAKEDRHDQIVLRAGNSGTYHKEHRELKLIPNADPNTISWKTRELIFEETSLQEAVDLINKVYNAHLVIMNQELAGCPITVTFNEQSLDAILHVLESTLDLTIRQEGEQITLEGEGCIE